MILAGIVAQLVALAVLAVFVLAIVALAYDVLARPADPSDRRAF